MTVVSSTADPHRAEWRRVTDPTCTAFRVDFEYSLLGYDIDAGHLDMLLRYGSGCHCRRHRHIAATATLVLDGEQHLLEWQPDGTTRRVQRKRGDYALAAADALPHDEWGGESGGTVLLSMNSPGGLLFEYFDPERGTQWTVSVAQFVEAWMQGIVYGHPPG